jgi:hypothetical protein
MEGSSFVVPERPERTQVLRCTECGDLYFSHEPGDAAEELCNQCFEARFAPQSEAHAVLLADEKAREHRIAA